MKTSFVSTSTIAQSLRYQTMRLQTELLKGETELSSGILADKGVVLGARTGNTVSFTRDIDRLETMKTANSLAATRLSTTQTSMDQMIATGDAFFKTLMAAQNGDASPALALSDAKSAFSAIHDIMNMSVNGDYIFGGVNTDIKPLPDFSNPSDPARQAFDAAFALQFGFSQNDPQAANITGAQMQAFLDGPATDLFLGAGWATLTSASDQPIITRITTGETAQTSVTAHDMGMRHLIMGSVITMGLLGSNVSAAGVKATLDQASSLVGSAVSQIAGTQAEMGTVQQKISRANERTEMQISLFTKALNALQGIDPYEASTRVTNLMTQIETSYALTARLSQLSLLNYLPR